MNHVLYKAKPYSILKVTNSSFSSPGRMWEERGSMAEETRPLAQKYDVPPSKNKGQVIIFFFEGREIL